MQNPAAAQSLVGVKTTFSIIPKGGLAPLGGSTRDVLGPIAKTTLDAAMLLDVMTRYGTADFVGDAPDGGYTALFGNVTLDGARVGLFGPGWRNVSLAPEVTALYGEAVAEIEALGATTVPDPFAGTEFASLSVGAAAGSTPVGVPSSFDSRGIESIPHDFFVYFQGLGIDSYADFAATAGVSPFAPGQNLASVNTSFPAPYSDVLQASFADPAALPDLAPFETAKAAYVNVLTRVFDEYALDALVFPQAQTLVPDNFGADSISALTVSEINIAGVPAVTVPSTHATAANGGPSPFSLIFVGLAGSEAKLLALAHDYEQATMLRHVPKLQSELPAALV